MHLLFLQSLKDDEATPNLLCIVLLCTRKPVVPKLGINLMPATKPKRFNTIRANFDLLPFVIWLHAAFHQASISRWRQSSRHWSMMCIMELPDPWRKETTQGPTAAAPVYMQIVLCSSFMFDKYLCTQQGCIHSLCILREPLQTVKSHKCVSRPQVDIWEQQN